MAIKAFIKKVCTQPVVYWEYIGPDGMGGAEFEDAVEIKVRWDEHTNIVSDDQGREFLSRAEVLTPQDLLEQSYLWLGELADLPADPDPKNTAGAFEIKKMDRHPLFRSQTLDVFIAYLG